MGYSFSVSGVKEFQKLLNTEDKINKVKDVVRVNTAQLARNASKFVPVDTGTLARSGNSAILDGGMTGEYSFNTNYSAYVEYGTRFMYGRFYLKRAFDLQTEKFYNDIKGALN